MLCSLALSISFYLAITAFDFLRLPFDVAQWGSLALSIRFYPAVAACDLRCLPSRLRRSRAHTPPLYTFYPSIVSVNLRAFVYDVIILSSYALSTFHSAIEAFASRVPSYVARTFGLVCPLYFITMQ